MSSRNIFRLPPYVLGPRVFFYNEVEDSQPWSLVHQNIEPLWADTQGKGVTVAVLDTGLWDHRDLPSPAFAANFSRSRNIADRDGHATHVAGTIGARLDGAGVVGYAPECDIAAVKVLGDDGSGTGQAIAEGIYYAAEQGADIINMSLGGGFDAQIARACRDVIQQGVFLICAAGNEGRQGVGYPAKLEETLAIASYNKGGKISGFSSRGPEVDVAFPGEDILSTWPGNKFVRLSGTSMATPAAAGLTALMLAYHRKNPRDTPVRNNSDLRNRWREHAQDMGAPGKDNSFGWGIPDTDGVVRAGTDAPDPEPPPDDGGDITPTGPGFSLFDLIQVVPAKLQEQQGLFVYVSRS